MKWITATDLQEWSNRIDARALLIEMVADLIRASHAQISHFRFPSGDKAQVRGFDGDLDLESEANSTYIPFGQSKWEFGVSAGSDKPKNDFNKRTKGTVPQTQNQNTLVLVNLHTWDHPTLKIPDFVEGLKKESDWKDILFIDGTQLENWLQHHPAVAAKYAKNYLKLFPQSGVMSTDEYWLSFRSRFDPPITESVLTCEQEHLTSLLNEHLSAPPKMLMIGAENPEDVIAYSVAAIRSLPDEVRSFVESRTLIVDSREAARQLTSLDNLILILKGEAIRDVGILSTTARVIVPATGVQGRNARSKLIRPTSANFGKAIETMGIEADQAYSLAQKCGRSLTIFQRQNSNGPKEDPSWLKSAEVLIPAVLAGGWSTDSELDKSILKLLAQKSSYEEYESIIRPLLVTQDPPIDNVNDVWATRSQADAFYFVSPLIGKREQDIFKESVIKVLSARAPKPSPDAPFTRASEQANTYSNWLKDGLANTLLQIVTISQDCGFRVYGTSNQRFVDSIIQALPGWGRRHETIVAISEQLVVIAEASPDSFLDALESLLEGDHNEILAFFTDSDKGIFAKTSPHTYLLWALEVLAWDPKYFIKSCLILIKLANRDPGGSTTNRPINSLREIIIPWSPSTYATCDERLACLDAIVKAEPIAGWELLVSLLPSNHDTSSATQKPKLRDVAPREPEILTYAHVWKAQAHIVNKAIDYAKTDDIRLFTLIGHISDFAPPERKRLLTVIDEFLTAKNSFEGSIVWHRLQDEVRRHEFFNSAEWALDPTELQDFRNVIEHHFPKDPLVKYSWLFDDWMPHVGDYEDKTESKIDQARNDAIKAIYILDGVTGIYKLISKVKLKHLVIEALAKSDLDFDVDLYISLLDLLLNDENTDTGAISGLSGLAFNKFANLWQEHVSKILETQSNPKVRTALVINWSPSQNTWSFIEGLGQADEKNYWDSVNLLPHSGTKEDLNKAINKLYQFGKAVQIIHSLYNRVSEVDTSILIQVLGAAISQLNENPKLMSNMFAHYVEKILKELRLRPELSLEDMAKIEFAYINVLDHDIKNLSIHKYVVENPDFYMQLICNMFIAKDEPRPESTPEKNSNATASFHVLNTLGILPGQAGDDIDYALLEDWVFRVRELAAIFKREDITDQYIGHILAHSPLDNSDNIWPHTSVRKIIEELANPNIEMGISVERFNMRGVYGKGFYEGGAQELSIANNYKSWAEAINGYSRTKSLLNRLYDEWINHANEADIRAEKRKLNH